MTSLLSSPDRDGGFRLSALLNMPTKFSVIEKTVGKLRAQTVCEDVELVIAAMSGNAADIDTKKFAGLGGWRIVTLSEMANGASGWAACTRASRSPLVVLMEDHSFPEPGWAEALIEAHRGDHPSVSPSLRNANPATAVSCANFLQCFLDWVDAPKDRLLTHGAGHNTSYKLEALLPYIDRLEFWFNPERVLHFDFEARGQHCLLAADAVTNHINISLPGGHLAQSFDGGRVFGEGRAAAWPMWRRIVFAGGAWLVPAMRLARVYSALALPEQRAAARFWPALPWLILGLSCHAAGEAAGYLFGAGASAARYKSYESNRREWVIEKEQALWSD